MVTMLYTRRLVLIFVATLLAPYSCSTHAVAQVSTTNTKLGSIKGRVVSDGQPLNNAVVSVSSVNIPRQSRAVPTNDNGDFEVKGLETGLYRVQVNAPAYVSPPGDADQELYRVGDSITVNMLRGGVITGKVLTERDDPVVAVRVRALMIRDANGRRPDSVEESNDKLTDDRGTYRIFGLAPGTYVVYAGGRGFSGTGANAYDNDAPTFAPSSSRDTAEQISLAAGDERTIDIRYRGAGGHAISGNVIAPTTADSPWISINLDRVVKSALDFRLSTYQRAGTKGFDFRGVADGDYLIWARYWSRSDEALISEPKRITVKGADISGIELVTKPLASVAGVVLVEPSTIAECEDKRRPLFNELIVSLKRNQRQPSKASERDQQLELPLFSSSQVSPDGAGSFQMRNLAVGEYHFDLRTIAKYWYLRSVTLPAAKDATPNDLARGALTLRSGERVTGLKATLAEGAASISGQVELPEDRRSDRIVFYVVPAEKDRADDVLRYFAAPVVDDGTFSLDHVPPGRYWTIAKVVTTENDTNTTALRLPLAAAARVRLRREGEAGKSEIELRPCQTVRNHKVSVTLN